MKKLSILFALMLLVAGLSAQWPSNMGPDGYGYTAETFDNNDQRYIFLDLSVQPGAQLITGLDDDNSVGPFDLGFDFQFYWLKHRTIYVGSNGYISFGQGNNYNYASTGGGFDTVGTQNNREDLVAGMLSDLSFAPGATGTPNPGVAYFWTNNQDLAIISFEDVPFWNNASPDGFAGRNSFQIHLSAVDSSVKVIYDVQEGSYDPAYDPDPNDPFPAQVPVAVGIENVSGTFALNVNRFVPASQSMPTAKTGIIFKAPAVPSGNFSDVEAIRIQNPESAGFFVPINGADVFINTDLFNSGGVDIKSQTTIEGSISGSGGFLYIDDETVDTVNSGDSRTFTFSEPLILGAPGSYEFVVDVRNPDDQNGSNDFKFLEVNALDTAGGKALFDYTQIVDNNQIDAIALWSGANGQSGIGTYIEPYGYPTTIEAIEVFVLPNTFGGQTNLDTIADGDLRLTLHLGTPETGIPGNNKVLDTVIDRSNIDLAGAPSPNGGVFLGDWNRFDLAQPITIDSGGIFVAWYHFNDSLILGGETSPPISLRMYEILNDSWAPHRSRELEDFAIRLRADISQVVIDTTTTSVEPELSDIVAFEAFPNPSQGLFTVTADFDAPTEAVVRVYNMNGAKVYLNFHKAVAKLDEVIDLRDAAKGIYIIQVETPKGVSTRKLTVQ